MNVTNIRSDNFNKFFVNYFTTSNEVCDNKAYSNICIIFSLIFQPDLLYDSLNKFHQFNVNLEGDFGYPLFPAKLTEQITL